MELRTARLRLRPYAPADFELLFRELVLDPEVTRLWGDYADPALTLADKRAMAEHDLGAWIEEGIAAGYPTWIAEAATRPPAPRATSWARPASSRRRTRGARSPRSDACCVAPPRARARHRGARRVIADATSRLGIPILVAIVDEANGASIRLVEKCGFSLERTFAGEDGRAGAMCAGADRSDPAPVRRRPR